MTSIADSSVKIQTTSESNPSPPSWFGEAVLLITSLHKNGILTRISEGVRFASSADGSPDRPSRPVLP
jgi:Lhr-like helicase